MVRPRGQIRFFVLLQIRLNSVGFAVFRSSEPMTEIILSGRQDVLRWKMSQYISRSSIVNSAPYKKTFIWFCWFSSNSIIIYFLSIYLSIEVGRPCFNSFFLLPPTLTKLYKRIKKTKKMKRTKRTKKKKIKIVETKASRRSVSEAVILLLYE